EGIRGGYHWLYFLIFSLILCGLTLLILKNSYDSRLSNAQFQNSLTTSAGAEIFNRLFENISTLFPGIDEVITRLPHSDTDYQKQIQEVLLARQRENPHLMDLLVTDDRGRIIHWTGRGNPPDVTDRAYIYIHLNGTAENDRYVGKPRLSKVHKGQWFFAVSRAIRDEKGGLMRILVAIIDISYLHSALLDIERPEQGTFVVASRDGFLYSRVPDHEKFVGNDVPLLRQLPGQTQDIFSETFISPLDQVERIISLRQTREPDLLFISSLSVDTVLAPWYVLVKISLSGLIAILLLVGILTFRLHRGHRNLLHVSTYDGLSGLLNRPTFMRLAQRELANIRRHSYPLSAILLDLDDFKKINDLHGHPVGDSLIHAVGQLLNTFTRECDLCCRYGGEEFLLLLPHTGLEGASELAEKLRTQIEAIDELPRDSELRPSSSFGIAELKPDEPLESLFNRADQAMYRAKYKGKNRIELDPPDNQSISAVSV
ncbi:MAG: GGDEF domain-containing protein, partial [Gammaproteobacteria bacterium]|nr:GGDEF domain-containing protein [Gammaproteobacteria bacterium]